MTRIDPPQAIFYSTVARGRLRLSAALPAQMIRSGDRFIAFDDRVHETMRIFRGDGLEPDVFGPGPRLHARHDVLSDITGVVIWLDPGDTAFVGAQAGPRRDRAAARLSVR